MIHVKLSKRTLLLTGGILIFTIASLQLTDKFFINSDKTDCALTLGSDCLNIERAATHQKRQQGLSGREAMPENSGMLFVFDEASQQCIWMKDMKFDLDIIWLDESKTINKIEKSVSPATFPRSFCAENTKYVLELNSGSINAYGLNVGTTLKF